MKMREPAYQTARNRLEPRLAAVLCYLLGAASGVIILMFERRIRFVRFHAVQSILYSAVVTASLVALVIAGLTTFAALFGAGALLMWLYLMYRAAKGQWYQLAWLGRWAERSV